MIRHDYTQCVGSTLITRVMYAIKMDHTNYKFDQADEITLITHTVIAVIIHAKNVNQRS